MEKLQDNQLIHLSESELQDLNGGGFFYDALYVVGYIFGNFSSAQARDLNGNIGGPTANHS